MSSDPGMAGLGGDDAGVTAGAEACGWMARGLLLAQMLATVAVLAWLPGNWTKLAAMTAIWALGFRRLARAELIAMAVVNLLFVGMNSAALKRGIFTFEHPDFIGMPVYEFAMWGFYTLHTIRLLEGPAPVGGYLKAVAAAAAFSLPFGSIAEPDLLLAASAGVLALTFVLFHRPMDFAYAGYMVGLGALIEYAGVTSGQWHYPGHPAGGVPLWFATMWAGVGLFTRRLVLPPLAQRRQAGG